MKAKHWVLGGTALLLFLSFRYFLPLVLPFVLAYFFAKMVSPMIRFITEKWHWNHKLSAILVVAVTFFAIIGFVLYIGSLVLGQGISLLQKIPIYHQMMDHTLEEICLNCDQMFELSRGTSYQYMEAQTARLYRNIGNEILPQISSYIGDAFRLTAKAASGLFIFFLSTMLILFDDTFPKVHKKIRPIVLKLKGAGLAYIKAQGIIIFIIAAVTSVGLLLMGNEYAVLFGICIAIFDAFPVVGSGVILVPWAILKILSGNYLDAAILASIFVVAVFLREVLEPKLFGKEIGMKPLFVLISVYVGAELFGVGGILLGPIALTVLQAVNDMLKEEME